MKTTQVLRYVLYSTIVSVLWFARGVKGQETPILLARWSSEAADTIGLTDGEFAGIYDSDFSLIQSFTLPPILSPSQIAFQASVWSPNLDYVHRVVLYDDTYTGPSPNKAILQVWRVDTQQLVSEHLGFSIHSGVIWNQQSTRFAFAIPMGLGSDNLLIFDTAGNQIAELTPPISGLIDRITWNSDGSLIAFNTAGDLHIWDFALNQYLASPTNSFQFESSLHFSAISNQLAYVEHVDSLDAEAIIIWDPDISQEVGQLLGHQDMIFTFDWQADRIASVGLDDTVRIWNSQTLQQVAEYPRGFITQVQLSPDANILLTNGPEPSTYQTVDPLTGQVLSTNYCAITVTAGDVSALISTIDAANAAPDPDTICLAADSTYTLTAAHNTQSGANGLPPITTDITLVGNGATITRDAAAPPFRFLYVGSTGALTLEDVTLTGGLAGVADPGDNGGAVYNLGTLTLIDTAITASSANGDGGGIYNAGTLTLSEASQIEGNFAADDGGGIYSTAGAVIVTDSAIANNSVGDQGGGIRSVTSTVTLTNASLTGNSASSASGGGLYATSTELAVHGGTISGNVANTGGGLYLTNSPSSAQIDGGVQIVNNSATSGGGLYLSEDGQAALTNVRVAGNQASSSSAGIRMGGTLTITDSEISNNGSATQPGSGGGIRASGALTIINSTLSGNQVSSSSGLGAGIYVADGGIVSVSGGEASDNHAYRGGGFYVTGSLSLSTTVSENSATGHGGGLYVSTGTATADYCTFTGNTALVTGGGIYNNALLQAANTIFSGNSAQDRAGAVYAGSVTGSWVHNSCISGNTSPNTGGVYSGPTGFDATNNWWGAADGPSGAGSGSGDAVNNKVVFTPFLTTGCPAGAGAQPEQGIMSFRAPTPLSVTSKALEPQRLPIDTSFEDEMGWRATGTWLLDTLSGHNDAPSWAVNTVPRDQTSILELLAPVELGRARSPRLTFWQRGQIAASDMVMVEVLPEDETDWVVIDRQTSLPTDWTPRKVDLSAYRGQTVQLRVRVVAGGELSVGDRTLGLWLDDLSITSR